jgi:formylglycine-generating enzyme required for sulfatase activity
MARLPSEAEWEYACRSGSQSAFSFGNDDTKLGDHAWYYANRSSTTQPVGGKKPNAWGLYDLHGNVWEWCEDGFGNYSVEPQADPTGPNNGDRRVLRGGGWGNAPVNCRSANRLRYTPGSRVSSIGFRVAMSLAP